MRSPDRRLASRAVFLLVALSLAAGPSAASAATQPTKAPPVVLDSSAPAFQYYGAWGAAWLGVQIAPEGTATFRVRQASWLKMTVWAAGGAFTTSVDGVTSGPTAIPDCECFKTLPVASNLPAKLHVIVVTNASADHSFAVRTWIGDPAARFQQFYWAQPSLPRVLSQGSSFSFTVRNAASVNIGYVANGVKVRVGIDDRYLAFLFTGPTSGAIAHQVLAWGLTAGLEKITLTVVQGTLDIRSASLLQAAGLGSPSLVDSATLSSTPLLGVYGDSIASGLKTLGQVRDSDGFADRLATLRGWRVTGRGLGGAGAGAGCWAPQPASLNRIINAHPDVVMVAFGTNDMIPGPDYYGCDDKDTDQFRAGMDIVLDKLAEGLPGVPLFVGAIIPTPRISESTRATWNQALSDVAADHSVPVIDASSVLQFSTDYADDIHPNNRGHQKMAAYWDSAIGTLALD